MCTSARTYQPPRRSTRPSQGLMTDSRGLSKRIAQEQMAAGAFDADERTHYSAPSCAMSVDPLGHETARAAEPAQEAQALALRVAEEVAILLVARAQVTQGLPFGSGERCPRGCG